MRAHETVGLVGTVVLGEGAAVGRGAHPHPPVGAQAALDTGAHAQAAPVVSIGEFLQQGGFAHQLLVAIQKGRFFERRLQPLLFGRDGQGDHQLFPVAEEVAVFPLPFHADTGIGLIAGSGADRARRSFTHHQLHGQDNHAVLARRRHVLDVALAYHAEQAQAAELVHIVLHPALVPGLRPGLPGGAFADVGRADVLVALHHDLAQQGRRTGIHHDLGIEGPGRAVEEIALAAHLGQRIATAAQAFGQFFHGFQHLVGRDGFTGGDPAQGIGKTRGRGRFAGLVAPQGPQTAVRRPPLAVLEGRGHHGDRLIAHRGPAQHIAGARRQMQAHRDRFGRAVHLEGRRTVIIALGMQQLDRRLHIAPGPALQGQQAVRRVGAQLLQLAQVPHLVRQAAVPLGGRRRGSRPFTVGGIRLWGCRSGLVALLRAAAQGHALGFPVRIRGRGAFLVRGGAALPVHFDGQLVRDSLALSGGHLGPAVIT